MIDVAIIGGGAAGIGAARALAGRCDAVLLEAGDRLGGRARTVAVEGMPLDLGCGYLHSADRNPWVAIAEAAGAVIERGDPGWRDQYRDLGFTKAEQREAGEAWAAFDQRLRELPGDRAGDALDRASPWTPYIEALSGYINGAEFERVSAADYLAYDDAATDANWRLPGGYGAVVAGAMPASVPVRLNTPVTRVDHRGRTLWLETSGGTVEVRFAIVTVSTTVLATGALRFDPPLPDKRDAAASLPLGLADKTFLALGEGHGLDPDVHLLGDLRRSKTGSYQVRPFGRPVIECFFGGRAARALEGGDMAAFAIDELVSLLGSNIREKLRPIAASAWAREAWIGGSYSHALPGRRDARAVLAQPVDQRLFFAGEACSPADFSTAHGALATGMAAAEAALAALEVSRSATPF